MGDGESPSFAEAMALQKAKQSALEEAGTYVESYTKSINQDLTKDEIQTLSGGVLQVEVIEKTRTLVNDGLRIHLKIRSTVTTDNVEELAQRIKGKNVAAEYKTLQVNYDALVKEVGQLKQTIANSPPSIERETALNRIREREQSFANLQRDEKALFKTLVQGQVLVADAKKVLSLSSAITNSMLNSGLQIEIGEFKPTLLRYAPEQVELEVNISLRLSEDFSAVLQKVARDRQATEEKVTTYREDLRVNNEKPLQQATLFRFPDTKEIREELWYLQESLSRFRVIVEFFGDKKTLGSCRFPYLGLLLYPGVIPEDKSQKISASEIHNFVASTSKYFASETEYQEFKRLDELVLSHWRSAFKKWEIEHSKWDQENEKMNQPSPSGVTANEALQEMERREAEGQLSPNAIERLNEYRASLVKKPEVPSLEDFPKEIQEASKKRDALVSQAWDRLLNDHPPLIRIDRAVNTNIQSPSLLIVNERHNVRSQKFVMSERMLQELKETTAHLVLEKRPTYNPSSPSHYADQKGWLDSQREGCEATTLNK